MTLDCGVRVDCKRQTARDHTFWATLLVTGQYLRRGGLADQSSWAVVGGVAAYFWA